MRPSHPRRTPATPRPHAALRRAVAEVLENRTLLTTITGGDTFEFSASDDTWVRIVATGNITAEFIGASTGPAVGTTALRDLPGQFFAGPKAGQVSGGGLIFDFSATLPVDIYRIVITSSDANATLSVAAVEPLDPDEPGKARNAKPFDESVGAIRALNLDSDEVDDIDAPDGTGAVLIGTRVSDGTGNEEIVNTPILTATTSTAFGTVPAGTTLPPGITMLPGNEIGRLTIGGTITGTVDLGGSVDLFYAGWVITGNATGESSAFADPTIPDNFRVRGDVRNLIVKGGTGHTGLEVTDDEVKLTYNTGFDAEIDGEVGHFQSLDTFMGNVQVSNTPGVGSETRSTFEFERYQKDVEDDAGPAFEQG
ncbi:MAG TPA: hypothetical protein VK324_02220, partial [Tepidisphaeraceae bacterium]|nr:hypothetical protein [Tepidisphaeraceae bacterium]